MTTIQISLISGFALGVGSTLLLVALLQRAKDTPLPYADAEDQAERERAVFIKHARDWKREDVLNVRNN